MVRLTTSQAKFLTELQEARKRLDKQYRLIEDQARLQKAHARIEVSKVVASALEAGVPARQIAVKGLGYSDVKSLTQYLDTSDTGRMVVSGYALTPEPATVQGAPELVSDTADEPDAYPTGRYITKWKRANGEPMNKVIVYAYMPDHDELTFRGATVWEQGITDVDEQDAIDGAMLEYLTRRYGRDDFVNVKIEK